MDAHPENITIGNLQDLLGELRAMARCLLNKESDPQSLTPTALAMTALRRAKLAAEKWEDVKWENKAHFFSILSRAMRNALVDHARKCTAKGRDKVIHVPWNDSMLLNLPAAVEERPAQFLALDEALERLKAEAPNLSDTINQFYFAGYTVGEMAGFSGLSEKTVDRNLKRARTLLKRLMEEPSRRSRSE